MPLLDLEAPAHFDEKAVREHVDISNAATNSIDVTEWVANVSPPMSTTDLGTRMGICERFVLDGIIEPMMGRPS
ncbi:hypothetical protein A5643_04055 [Mycobacterium sp. 1274756.6]|nr:hypothetical protein A5643_04055 [Mycobacterium sp. 1274756.6]